MLPASQLTHDLQCSGSKCNSLCPGSQRRPATRHRSLLWLQSEKRSLTNSTPRRHRLQTCGSTFQQAATALAPKTAHAQAKALPATALQQPSPTLLLYMRPPKQRLAEHSSNGARSGLACGRCCCLLPAICGPGILRLDLHSTAAPRRAHLPALLHVVARMVRRRPVSLPRADMPQLTTRHSCKDSLLLDVTPVHAEAPFWRPVSRQHIPTQCSGNNHYEVSYGGRPFTSDVLGIKTGSRRGLTGSSEEPPLCAPA